MFLENYRAPIPENARVKDGKVQFKIVYGGPWTTIGKIPPSGPRYRADGKAVMIPNSVYRRYLYSFYNEEVADIAPDIIPAFFRERPRAGLFAIVLGAVTKSGLYDVLIDVFGVLTANALLDLAMFYNIREQLDLDSIHVNMQEYIMFSVRAHTQEWYEDLVERPDDNSGITEDKIQEFMERWSQLRQKANPAEDTVVHLSWTTANQGCWDGVPETAGRGVLAACEAGGEYPGLPLAYHLYSGTLPERSDLQEASDLFQTLGLAPKRIVSGKFFCSSKLLATFDELQLPWLVMLHPYDAGHDDMLRRHEEELAQGNGTPVSAREPLTAACEADLSIFGAENPDRKAFVSLYCISKEAQKDRASFTKLLDHLYEEACTALDKLQAPGAEESLPIPQFVDGASDEEVQKAKAAAEKRADDMLHFAVYEARKPLDFINSYAWNSLRVEYLSEEGQYRCVIDEDEARYNRCLYSYIGLASSEPMSPQEMADEIPLSYYLGDTVFRTYSAMHHQLNTERIGHLGFAEWFFVSFISDIVRALLMPSFQAARDRELREELQREKGEEEEEEEEELKGRDPKVFISMGSMLADLHEVFFYRGSFSSFIYFGNTNGVRGDALEAAGFPVSSLPYLSDLVNSAEDMDEVRKLRQMRRTIPVPPAPTPRKRGRPSKSKKED